MEMNKQAMVDKNSREYLTQKVKSGRGSLLVILLLTVLNLIMLVVDSGTYFLFSASVPYYLTMICKGIDNNFIEGPWPVNGTCTIVALVVSAVILVLYLLCWLLSKKHSGWIIAAMVMFIVDTVALVAVSFLLLENPAGNIMDILIHAWAIWELVSAVRCAGKLKNMPEEVKVIPEEAQQTAPEIE